MDLEFPRKFGEEDAAREDIPAMMLEIKQGHNLRFLENNLRPASEDNVHEMLENSLKGWEPD